MKEVGTTDTNLSLIVQKMQVANKINKSYKPEYKFELKNKKI